MKSKWLLASFAFSLWLMGVCLAGPTSRISQPPIPPDLVVEAPNAGLPPEVKAFSGKWRGRWYDASGRGTVEGLNAVIVVEKIVDPEHAIVTNAWADSPEWNVTKGVGRYAAEIGKNAQGVMELSYSTPSGRSFRFTISPEGRLNGTAKTIGIPSFIEMDKF